MRRLTPLVLFVLLAVGGFWGAWYLLHSPYYSLYQIGKAIHERQPRLFLAYVDLNRIIATQKDDLLAEFLPKDQDSQSRQTVEKMVSAFMGPIQDMAKERVVRIISDPKRENLPTSWALVAAASVRRNQDAAMVVLSDPDSGKRLRLGMERYPEDGHWRVVQIDPKDLRRLLGQYLEDEGYFKKSGG